MACGFYQNIENPQVRFQAMAYLRDQLGDTPILFTLRTDSEGGMAGMETEEYIAMNLDVIETGLMDLIDVELSKGDDTMRTLVEAAHPRRDENYSFPPQHFTSTPSKGDNCEPSLPDADLGADIAKYAVMPQNERDVLTLLDATLTMREEHKETPVITMSMGRQGNYQQGMRKCIPDPPSPSAPQARPPRRDSSSPIFFLLL